MFRYKKSLGIDYEKQKEIYDICHDFDKLDYYIKFDILNLFLDNCGEYWLAIFEYMTQNVSVPFICSRHYMSSSTFNRYENKMYLEIYRYFENGS